MTTIGPRDALGPRGTNDPHDPHFLSETPGIPRVVHIHLDDPETLRDWVVRGVIWRIPAQFWQLAIDAYEKKHLVTREEFLTHAPVGVRRAYGIPETTAEKAAREAEQAAQQETARQREAEQQAERAAAQVWACPEHGTTAVSLDRDFPDDRWTSRCRVGDCQRSYRQPPPDPADSLQPGGWECPRHGRTGLKTLTSGQGRVYRCCVYCREFER